MTAPRPARGRLFRKYVILLVSLCSAVLGASAVLEIYSSYQENKTTLLLTQKAEAVAAASSIERFITEVERQIELITASQGGQSPEQQGLDYLRLFRQAPAITDIGFLDASGREQFRLSRLALDSIRSQKDFSKEPPFLVAKAGKTYMSPAYFREESEPYLTIAMASSGADGGVTVAEVNLKLIWEVVSRIRVGKAGHAYVVDSRGNLIAHPNISMVLRKTSLLSLPQVRAAQAGPARLEREESATIAKNLQGQRVLTAYARIAPLDWFVFVEQPLEEAFEPVSSSILRSVVLLLGALGLSVLASLVLARKIVTPIRALQAGAARIGAGDLSHRIQIQTGDELQALGEEFNRTAAQLQESYANLEEKVEARTRDLTRALDELRALGEIGRVISSTLDLQTVLTSIVSHAVHLCGADSGSIFEFDEPTGVFHLRATHQTDPELIEAVRTQPIRLGEGLIGQAAVMRQPVQVHDLEADGMHEPRLRALLQRVGVRAVLAVPLLREGRVVGGLSVRRRVPGEFSPDVVDRLQTFATQSALAIQNARLFAELNQSYRDLQHAHEELIRSEKLRALGQMAAGIAHDLNNTLAAILGQVELLRLHVPAPDVQERLAILVTAATDGAQVVRRLQGFARQQVVPTLIPCDLATLVREAVELTRPRWRDEPQQRGVVVQVQTAMPPSGGPSLILGQPTEIREALINLILNAVDAMPGGGTLTIAARPIPRPIGQAADLPRPIDHLTSRPVGGPEKQWVELTLTDTGVGMPEEIRRRIFEPFFTTKGGRGTGLGLSVVYGIMERHGGHVEVTSAPGRGTTFSLRFRAAPPGLNSAEASPGAPRVSSRRLLVIDDDPMVRQTLVALLRTVGHTVAEADGGAAGIARLAEDHLDCVITDLGMPEVTGWDVARAAKAHVPRLPIILLTGWGEFPARDPETAGLVDRILGKPVRLDDLLGVIETITRQPAVAPRADGVQSPLGVSELT